jgi:transcriptional regulator NrdR family protein
VIDSLVIKRGGKRPSEKFDPAKLHASIEAACSSVNLPSGVAEDTAQHVVNAVGLWLRDKPEVTSADIRRIATQALNVVSPEAGYLYKHHHTMV